MNPNDHRTIQELQAQLRDIHQHVADSRQAAHLPIVTVSFAQSLDGKIAPYKDLAQTDTLGNYPLSGPESLSLTHAIRSMHDGILIGGKTLAIDNPRLNNRLWDQVSKDENAQPVPIILDTHLNHLANMKAALRARNPIICCSEQAADSLESLPEAVILCPCPCGHDGRIDLRQALTRLHHHHHVRKLMVEGGAQVIESFFEEGLVDAICLTIAPKLLGHGISPNFGPCILELAGNSGFHILGKDCILISPIQ